MVLVVNGWRYSTEGKRKRERYPVRYGYDKALGTRLQFGLGNSFTGIPDSRLLESIIKLEDKSSFARHQEDQVDSATTKS